MVADKAADMEVDKKTKLRVPNLARRRKVPNLAKRRKKATQFGERGLQKEEEERVT